MLMSPFFPCRIIALAIILGVVDFDETCSHALREHVLGYLVILSVCVVLEATIAIISMRGSILDTEPRVSMQYLLYTRLGKSDFYMKYLLRLHYDGLVRDCSNSSALFLDSLKREQVMQYIRFHRISSYVIIFWFSDSCAPDIFISILFMN